MTILINASNIGFGGATQVTASICEGLKDITGHSFIVVLSPSLAFIEKQISGYSNVRVIIHGVNRSFFTKITGREKYLDNLVESNKVSVVLSVFGPTWWVPRTAHLCGFALAHIVMPESPYFQRMGFKERLKSSVNIRVMRYFFRKCSRCFYTENDLITNRLQKLFSNSSVFTVTNYYNQLYDEQDRWVSFPLPSFNGKTFLTLAAPYPHKNLSIAIDIAKFLKQNYPSFSFRFVFSIDEKDYPIVSEDIKESFLFIGKVMIDQCPSLYEQSDVVFQPTLLECFTAAYPEAMRMKKPIVTTDLGFAKGLCGDAAVYYNATSAEDAAKCLYRVSEDQMLRNQLVNNGIGQLGSFDNYSTRVNKLVSICESISLC